MMSIKNRVGGLTAVAIIVLLAGCSAGGGGAEAGGDSAAVGAADSSVAFADSGEAAGEPAGDAATGSGVAPGAESGASGAGLTRSAAQKGAEVPAVAGSDGAALPSGAEVVRTAGQTVRVDDVRAAAARARTAATALGGYVASENIYLGDPGGEPKPVDTGDGVSTSASTGATSTLTLRVPQKSTDTALDRLAGLGTELNRTSTADDVTAQVADLDSRVKSQEASVKRVRALLDRAESLKDVVLLESELSRREEELEAGQARSRALHDQAALATINLELVSKDSPPPVEGEDDGFLSGLSDGWDALGRSTVAVLTGVGAVLPFAVLLGVIAIPGFALWRRRSAGPSTASAPAPTPAPAPAQPVGPDQP